MQLSLRTLVSRAFDAADWVIIRTLSGVAQIFARIKATKVNGWITIFGCGSSKNPEAPAVGRDAEEDWK